MRTIYGMSNGMNRSKSDPMSNDWCCSNKGNKTLNLDLIVWFLILLHFGSQTCCLIKKKDLIMKAYFCSLISTLCSAVVLAHDAGDLFGPSWLLQRLWPKLKAVNNVLNTGAIGVLDNDTQVGVKHSLVYANRAVWCGVAIRRQTF